MVVFLVLADLRDTTLDGQTSLASLVVVYLHDHFLLGFWPAEPVKSMLKLSLLLAKDYIDLALSLEGCVIDAADVHVLENPKSLADLSITRFRDVIPQPLLNSILGHLVQLAESLAVEAVLILLKLVLGYYLRY